MYLLISLSEVSLQIPYGCFTQISNEDSNKSGNLILTLEISQKGKDPGHEISPTSTTSLRQSQEQVELATQTE
jgi:hypothetical protein